MHRRRLSFTESDGDIKSCSDIQTLNAGDEMIYGLDQSQESSLVSADILTVEGPKPTPEVLGETNPPPNRVGFSPNQPPVWPEITQDDFPPLASAQASQPDQFPPLMRSTTQATAQDDFDEEHGNEKPPYVYPSRSSRHFSRSPPRTILIGRARSRSRHRSLSRRPPRSSKLQDDETAPLSMWNIRLCGIRADRLIVLLSMILFLAVAVIVAALIYANRVDQSATQSSANTADQFTFTRSPVASPSAFGSPTILTPTQPAAPPRAPVASSAQEETPTPTRITTDPPTKFPTETPQAFPTTILPTTWPKKLCGEDDTAADFIIDGEINVNCTWVASLPDRATVCSAGSPAHFFCRETCENCETDTPWPSDVCGVDSTTAMIFAGPGIGSRSCNWIRQMYGGHGKRLCGRREFAFHACRETCRNCGPTGLWPTGSPTDAPVVTALAPASTQIVPTEAPALFATSVPTVQPRTDAPTIQSITESPTHQPTFDAPTSQPTEAENLVPAIRDIVVEAFPASAVRLGREFSPQSVAARWMEQAFDQGAYLDLPRDRLLQIYSLATFAYSTNVDRWSNRRDWLNWSVDECLWFGITCGGQSVIAIDLPSNGLSGPLPPEITLVQDSLRILVLSSNSIVGIVPTALGNLINLEELRIDRNDFNGILPTSIGRLRNLKLFYLEHNPSIRGAFPQTVLSMESLEELVFYYTSISSITSDICSLNLPTLIYDCKQITFPTCWTKCFYLCGGNTGIIC